MLINRWSQHNSLSQDVLQPVGVEITSLVTGRITGRFAAGRAATRELFSRSSLMTHAEAITPVQPDRPLIELRGVPLHVAKPQIGNLFSLLPSLLPDHSEVVRPAVVLRNGNGVVEVQHTMPPIARHKDDVSRALDAFINLQLGVGALDPWQYEVKVHDGFVIFAAAYDVSPLHNLFGLLRIKEHPALAAVCDGVPSRGTQGVGVHRRARTLRPNAEPAVWRPCIIVHESQPVMREEVGQLIIAHQRSNVAIVIHIGLEQVQGTVILLPPDVVSVVLELHPQFLAFVVLCHLECDVPEPLLQRLN
mmetsp:Transcript_92642/g.215266  ORF Transcript_92642/g.215266 Transcript_92642/m.215266 type:complete len:305 (-) Transcript_92642:618-1532(-)